MICYLPFVSGLHVNIFYNYIMFQYYTSWKFGITKRLEEKTLAYEPNSLLGLF